MGARWRGAYRVEGPQVVEFMQAALLLDPHMAAEHVCRAPEHGAAVKGTRGRLDGLIGRRLRVEPGLGGGLQHGEVA